MRRLLCIGLFFSSAAIVSAAEIDLVLLAGQSNMVGRAQIVGDGRGGQFPGASPLDSNTRFYFDVTNTGNQFQDDSGQTFGPLRTWSNDTTNHVQEFGPEFALARDLTAQRDNELALIKVAVGGAGIRRWQPNEVDYEAFVPAVLDGVTELVEAGHTVNLLGMAWLQGESDANSANAPLYAGRLDTLFTSLRSELNARFRRMGEGFDNLGFDTMPLVLVEPAGGRTSPSPNLQTVTQALRDFAANDANAEFVATNDLVNYVDNIHFAAPSQTEIGRRIASALTGTPYAAPASRLVQPNSIVSDSPRFGSSFDVGFAVRQVNTEFDLIPDSSSGSQDQTFATQTDDLEATLTMEFDTAEELTDLLIWNYRNGSNNGTQRQGVTSFSLSLYDGPAGTGGVLYEGTGTPDLAPAIGDIAPQQFGFGGSLPGVRSAVLTLRGDRGTLVGLHEIGFLSVPEPLSASLAISCGALFACGYRNR